MLSGSKDAAVTKALLVENNMDAECFRRQGSRCYNASARVLSQTKL